MRQYNLKCEVLTPVHIGSGEELPPYEYLISDSFYRLSLEKVLSALPAEKQNEMLQLMEKDLFLLRNFLRKNIQPEKYQLYCIRLSPEVKDLYNNNIEDFQNQLLIYPFIRTRNRPYLPGSSLKGAIRTAVLNEIIRGRNLDLYHIKPKLLEGTILGYAVSSDYGNRPKIHLENDPFRCLKISDVLLPNNSTIIKKIDILTNRGNIPALREVTDSFYAGNDLKINVPLLIEEQVLQKYNGFKIKIDPEIIINSCRNYYKPLLQDEINGYFKNNNYVRQIYQGLLSLLEQNDHTFLIRVGWGCGKDFMTLHQKYTTSKVKTRRLVDGKLPLGWLKIQLEEVKNV
ncbi:MAG TPA: type III-A CRISPR-associated RAMP protein Csm5 [Candidatus Atribacteria bacterium]|nr:type III-A CRISPR-associated RAMP protein Csm5 [Candidatus Atribacteria bacterium]